MKQISTETIEKIQHAYMRMFEAEDDDFPNGRVAVANKRAIQHYLDKITDDAEEQSKILDAIMRGSWNTEDNTFKPIVDKLKTMGYEVV